MFDLIFWLLVGHAVADYGLQSQYVAFAKNPNTPEGKGVWQNVLINHSLIHGGAVAFVTGYVWLGIAETIVHALTDYAKSNHWFGDNPTRAHNIDQALHIGAKVVWATIAVTVGNQYAA